MNGAAYLRLHQSATNTFVTFADVYNVTRQTLRLSLYYRAQRIVDAHAGLPLSMSYAISPSPAVSFLRRVLLADCQCDGKPGPLGLTINLGPTTQCLVEGSLTVATISTILMLYNAPETAPHGLLYLVTRLTWAFGAGGCTARNCGSNLGDEFFFSSITHQVRHGYGAGALVAPPASLGINSSKPWMVVCGSLSMRCRLSTPDATGTHRMKEAGELLLRLESMSHRIG